MIKNEYVIYWRREVLYRTKVIATSEEKALNTIVGLSSFDCKECIDEYGSLSIDNIELLEKDVD